MLERYFLQDNGNLESDEMTTKGTAVYGKVIEEENGFAFEGETKEGKRVSAWLSVEDYFEGKFFNVNKQKATIKHGQRKATKFVGFGYGRELTEEMIRILDNLSDETLEKITERVKRRFSTNASIKDSMDFNGVRIKYTLERILNGFFIVVDEIIDIEVNKSIQEGETSIITNVEEIEKFIREFEEMADFMTMINRYTTDYGFVEILRYRRKTDCKVIDLHIETENGKYYITKYRLY